MVARAMSLSADPKGLEQLREWLQPKGRCLVVVEATGGYERRLVAELIDAGHDVARVNPRQVRGLRPAASDNWRKPIASMPRVLALFAEKVQPRPCEKVPENQVQLDALLTRRRQLVQMKASEQVRLHQTEMREVRKSISHMLDETACRDR